VANSYVSDRDRVANVLKYYATLMFPKFHSKTEKHRNNLCLASSNAADSPLSSTWYFDFNLESKQGEWWCSNALSWLISLRISLTLLCNLIFQGGLFLEWLLLIGEVTLEVNTYAIANTRVLVSDKLLVGSLWMKLFTIASSGLNLFMSLKSSHLNCGIFWKSENSIPLHHLFQIVATLLPKKDY